MEYALSNPAQHPVKTSWIRIAGSAGTYDAYLALPPAGSGPGLVLFQEIFGVNGHIRGVAEQYALDGYVVLAPDVFWRQAPRVDLGYEGEDMQRAYALMQGNDPALLRQDIVDTVKALRARPEVGGRKVGAVGYCLGGRLAYAAAALAGTDAAVAYYGGGIQDQLDLVPRITCPMQFHYGALDTHIPPEAVEKVRTAFADKPAEVHVYPGANHGFNCWGRASYHAPSAALAHGRTLQFFANLF
ncbi:MAG: dienelactone hydrolase family protein [Proteobacteria bacterium]|nr:dienelactone hydrolase family protein [Pseudomonadota bacterium]